MSVPPSSTDEFQCSQCLKYFFSMELLRNHQHVHVNRYKCTMCDMTTSSPSGLVQHVRYRHVKEKPFACTLCDYGAVYKHDLDKHMLALHNNDKRCTNARSVSTIRISFTFCGSTSKTITVSASTHVTYARKSTTTGMFCRII